MSDNETIGLRVSFDVDARSVATALSANKSIADSLRSINASAVATSPAFKSISENIKELERRANINTVAQQFAALAVETKDAEGAVRSMLKAFEQSGVDSFEAAKGLQAYREELRRLQSDQKQLNVNQRNTAIRSALTNTRFAISDIARGDFGGAAVNAGQAIGRANELGINLTTLGDKLKAAGGAAGVFTAAANTTASALSAAATTLGALSSVILPIAAVAAAGAIALKAFQISQESANEATRAASAALKSFYADLGNLTTDQMKAQLENNRGLLNRLAQEQSIRTEQLNKFNVGQQLFRLDGIDSLQTDFNNTSKEIDDLLEKNKLLEASIKSLGGTTGDLKQQYTEETNTFLKNIAARQNAQEQIDQLLESGSVKQFDLLKKQNEVALANNQAAQEEIATKLRGMPITEENSAAVATLQAKQRELTSDYQTLTQTSGLLTDATRKQIEASEALRIQREQELAGYQKAAALQVQLQQLVTSGSGTTDQITQIEQQIEANKLRAQTELGLIFNSGVLDEAAQARIKTVTTEIDLSRQQKEVLDAFVAAQGNEIAHREQLQAAIDKSIKASDQYAESLNNQAELRRNATSEQLANSLTEIESKRATIEAQKAYVQEQIKTLGSSDAFTKKLQALDDELTKLATQKGDIEAVAGIVAFRDQLKALGDGLRAGVEATAKYAGDVKDIEQKAAQDRADIALDYNDKIIDIAREAAQKAEDALRDLEEKNADARVDLQRDLAKEDRKAQDDTAKVTLDYRRSEAKAFREHLRDLEKIRREAQDREFELAVNRDFAGLFFSRRDTARKLGESNADFIAKRQSEAESLRIKLQDDSREREIERRERIIAFQQKLQDAQLGYDRELNNQRINNERTRAEAQINRDRDLRDLQTQNTREFAQKQAAYAAELALIANNTKQRLALITSEQAAITGSIAGIFSGLASGATNLLRSVLGLFGGGVARRETGGSLNAFQASLVQERRPEGWNGIPFPSKGAGLYIPFNSGYVNRSVGGGNDSGGNVSVGAINVYEARDARSTAREVHRQLTAVVG